MKILLIPHGKTIPDKKMQLMDSFAGYEIWGQENSKVSHYQAAIIDNKLCAVLGSIIEEQEDVYSIHQIYREYGAKALSKLEGTFAYLEISEDGEINLCSDREGLFPLFYKQDETGLTISSECMWLFDGFKEPDIDVSAVYDFLRYGMLIGDHTFSKKVKLIQGGSELLFHNKIIRKECVYFFHHDSSVAVENESVLIEEIQHAYEEAIYKCIDRNPSELAVLLSGGMDSRMVLAAVNNVSKDAKIQCVSFGQPNCEELDVARKVAGLKSNQYREYHLMPEDFLKNVEAYAYISAGTDCVPQGYIIDVAQKASEDGITGFLTGSFIECHIGGTFLPDNALNYKGKLSDYVVNNVDKLKSSVFSDEELAELVDNKEQILKCENKNNLYEDALKYDDYPVRDVIQSFVINNRDKRLVLNRELTPGKYIDYLNPNFNIKFLNTAAKIPAERRIGRRFYRDFYINAYPDYANLVNNNNKLPISAPFELWKEGVANEYALEKLYQQVQLSNTSPEPVYYPHFYSDFDGYSRYNAEWRSFFEKTLFSNECWGVGRMFKREYVEKLYKDHLSGQKNNRKKLVYLASLEVFFKNVLKL